MFQLLSKATSIITNDKSYCNVLWKDISLAYNLYSSMYLSKDKMEWKHYLVESKNVCFFISKWYHKLLKVVIVTLLIV